MAVALDSSPASSGRQPGMALTISDTTLMAVGVVRADEHVGLDGLVQVAELGRRQVVERGDDPAVRHGRLHVRGHRAPGRDERLELGPDPHQRVGHADHDLALEARCVLVRRRRRGVPRRGDDHQVGLGGVVVGAGVDGQLPVRPPAPG